MKYFSCYMKNIKVQITKYIIKDKRKFNNTYQVSIHFILSI